MAGAGQQSPVPRSSITRRKVRVGRVPTISGVLRHSRSTVWRRAKGQVVCVEHGLPRTDQVGGAILSRSRDRKSGHHRGCYAPSLGDSRMNEKHLEMRGDVPALAYWRLQSRHTSSQDFAFLEPLKPTVVFETYWRFAAERQAIFFRRLEGRPAPWTDDPILQQHKFTNAYRASDRVSQYLILFVM
jgi:hypothetical protein